MTILRKIFTSIDYRSRTIASAAVILSITSLASGLLGLFRDRLLAGTFGAGDELDIYYAAFRIPNFVYSLLIYGALSAGFIPIFTEYLKEKDGFQENKEAWYLANNLLNIFILTVMAASVILIIFTPWLIKIIVSGFGPEKLALTIKITRLIFIETFFLAFSAVWSGILQSFKRFFIYSLAPIMYNLGIIAGILFLSRSWGIMGVAIGAIAGGFLHMAIQVPAVVASGYRYQWVFNLYHQGLLRILKLMPPRFFNIATSQINILAMTFIASGLVSGSLAIFNLAHNIVTFPMSIFAVSIAIAAFPTLSQEVNQGRWADFRKSFSSTFRQIIFFLMPITVFFIIMRHQIVGIILSTGKFGLEDTILTVNALALFSLGILADGLTLLLIRAFFALEDSQTPFMAGLISSVLRIGSAFILVKSLGVSGLALGHSLGGLANLFALWFLLKWRLKELDQKQILSSLIKITFCSLLAGLAVYIILQFSVFWFNIQTILGMLFQGLIAGLIGVIVYIACGLFLRSRETTALWRLLKHRLPWKKVAPEELFIINKDSKHIH